MRNLPGQALARGATPIIIDGPAGGESRHNPLDSTDRGSAPRLAMCAAAQPAHIDYHSDKKPQ